MAITLYNHALAYKRRRMNAIPLYRAAGQFGHARAFYELAQTYEASGPEMNTMLGYLHAAALRGCADAQYDLSVCYHEGKGVCKSAETAVEFMRMAAEREHLRAQTDLAYMYDYGLGTPRNEKKAAEMYEIAAAAGQPVAQYNLGVTYEIGKVVPKDLVRARALFQKSADQGCLDAQYSIAIYLHNGLGGEQDAKKAREMLERSISAGYTNAKCKYYLADMLDRGEGGSKDVGRAVKLYKEAAHGGYAPAQVDLGEMLQYGRGVKQDAKNALGLFELAAVQGHPVAQLNLAWCYENGICSANRDEKSAVYMYRRVAASKTCIARPKATLHLARLGLVKVDAVPANVVEHLEYDADMAYACSQTLLGWLHDQGICGVKQDVNKAISLYERAAANGAVWARQRLLELGTRTKVYTAADLESASAALNMPA